MTPGRLRVAGALVAMSWLLPVAASAWPSQEDVRELHQQLDALTQKLDALNPAPGASERLAVAAHLRQLDAHQRAARRAICGACEDEPAGDSRLQEAAGQCGGPDRVESSLSADEYREQLRPELHRMDDRLSRIAHEKQFYERTRLLRSYQRLVLEAIERARPVCAVARPAGHAMRRAVQYSRSSYGSVPDSRKPHAIEGSLGARLLDEARERPQLVSTSR